MKCFVVFTKQSNERKSSRLKRRIKKKEKKKTRRGKQATKWKEEKPKKQSEPLGRRSLCMSWSLM